MVRRAAPWTRTILVGDARTRLAELPAASVDCVITSPPYWGLRDYGASGQLGLEANVDGWVSDLRAVMAEVARVLTPTGSVWLNIADGYARHQREGAAKGSLLLGPERLAITLEGDGWIIRNKVVWAKSNPMPSSARTRLSNTYELIYFLTRSTTYYFDLHSIRMPHRSQQPKQAQAAGRVYPPPSAAAHLGTLRRTNLNNGLARLKVAGRVGHPWGRNPGDVWTLGTANFREAHFATFPLALAERPLLATCPERVCVSCGQPWRRTGSPATTASAATRELQPACTCKAAWRPGILLDPFAGAGTVALAAEAHGRDWIGIELSPEYAAMAMARIRRARAGRQPAATSRTKAA
ncbi:site-specific DNA-methyltransferase [Frankia sp. AgB1.9]|uniref:DNA-methyltransferase n=1 Tax=unclassified Frankia TaxID=2632575 RepID=UPI001932D11E|nr:MULTISPECIES: site-specific DNA-methyltransferase [unclassified Frankia]MBL7486776.1 site-specific DNA-methyltransferase [Frankia sp. AgW1.1]MBL7547914.1 site-specific DNA-methyltransferase [Frankia sp. AgB1.9]MBL7623961.1 site-specific DNA-methyltransferase [Frankia sp. AgB1.8]